MQVAYTLGHTASYNQSIESPKGATKLGSCEDYDGGWIWKTIKEADNFRKSDKFLKINWGDDTPRPPEKFSVFEVHLINGWQDISKEPNEDGAYTLLVDSRLAKIK